MFDVLESVAPLYRVFFGHEAAAKDCDRNVTKADENAKAENLLVTFEKFNC